MALSGIATAEMCMVDLRLDITLGSGVAAAQDSYRRPPATHFNDAAE
jgi:alanine-glyoxylate transaminase/serine-glyoxylate transaminase/serine-pyruvate transaminase